MAHNTNSSHPTTTNSGSALPTNALQQTNALPTNRNEECVGPTSNRAGKASSCSGCPNQQQCASGKFAAAAEATKKSESQILARLENVKNILLILSGKGGVGKSTVSSQLAWSLQYYGYQVGILDIDICGPSIARMMGVENEQVHKSQFGWTPVYRKNNLSVMSVAFLLSHKNDAIIWRGPRKNGLIKQFLVDVEWQNLDFLIIDCPPGTSDEHISIAQLLSGKKESVYTIMVTTPQEVSLLDVRKEISFANKVGLNILGIIENMNGFICPCCNKKSQIFKPTTGGAKVLCKQMNIQYLGSLPIDQLLLQCCENGKSFLKYSAKKDINTGTRIALINVIKQITGRIDAKYAVDIEKQENHFQKKMDNIRSGKTSKQGLFIQNNLNTGGSVSKQQRGSTKSGGGVGGGTGDDIMDDDEDSDDSDESDDDEMDKNNNNHNNNNNDNYNNNYNNKITPNGDMGDMKDDDEINSVEKNISQMDKETNAFLGDLD